MRSKIVLSCIFITLGYLLNAQCPNFSREGIHVVQPGETLYRLAYTYNTSVRELASFNGISEVTSIPICTELRIPSLTFYEKSAEPQKIVTQATPAPIVAPAPRKVSYTSSRSTFAQRLKASNGTHIANRGETFETVAQYYGYTIERLLEMNSLDPGFQLREGMVLVVSECYFKEGGVEYSRDTRINYGGTKNSAEPSNHTNTFTNNKTTGYNTLTGTSGQSKAQEKKDTKLGTASENTGRLPAKAAANYMKSEELEMIDEINLVRSNPVGYISYIEAYKGRIAKGEAFGSVSTCDELIRELRALKPLSVLEPMQCIYDAAKKHGEDGKARGSNDHVGSDGSWPWDRVLKACPDLTDGNENLVGGPASVRDAVIILLIDDGIPNRGHRRTMLKPEWKYLACYKIGKVGSMPNSWVQKYGY